MLLLVGGFGSVFWAKWFFETRAADAYAQSPCSSEERHGGWPMQERHQNSMRAVTCRFRGVSTVPFT